MVSPDKIDLYVGPYSSDSSIYLARILTDLEIPQISYAATSNSLGNQFRYPFFFRTIPADDKQVRLFCVSMPRVESVHSLEAYE